jgi:ABC-type transport system involved in cytochrome c biogenesis permease component
MSQSQLKIIFMMRLVLLDLSMFPIGTKPLMGWLTSFLSLGFCKICFTLISGLSSLAMVYPEPDNVDMLVASVVLGLLAPVLSFSVASGAGFSALSNISYSVQGFKMNSGIGKYVIKESSCECRL